MTPSSCSCYPRAGRRSLSRRPACAASGGRTRHRPARPRKARCPIFPRCTCPTRLHTPRPRPKVRIAITRRSCVMSVQEYPPRHGPWRTRGRHPACPCRCQSQAYAPQHRASTTSCCRRPREPGLRPWPSCPPRHPARCEPVPTSRGSPRACIGLCELFFSFSCAHCREAETSSSTPNSLFVFASPSMSQHARAYCIIEVRYAVSIPTGARFESAKGRPASPAAVTANTRRRLGTCDVE